MPDTTSSSPAREGVYQRAVGPLPSMEFRTDGVPSVFSAEWLRFVRAFARDPLENPAFALEWRRFVRRLGPLGRLRWYWPALGLAVLSVFVLPVARAALGESEDPAGVYALCLLPLHLLCVCLAFLQGLRALRRYTDRANRDELLTTPLAPDVLAWGATVGCTVGPAILLAFSAAPLGAIGISLHQADPGDPLVSPGQVATMVVLYMLFTLAAMLSAAGIATSCSLAHDRGRPALLAVGALGLCQLPLEVVALWAFGAGSFLRLVLTPVMIWACLGIGCAAIQNLAFEMARRRGD